MGIGGERLVGHDRAPNLAGHLLVRRTGFLLVRSCFASVSIALVHFGVIRLGGARILCLTIGNEGAAQNIAVTMALECVIRLCPSERVRHPEVSSPLPSSFCQPCGQGPWLCRPPGR